MTQGDLKIKATQILSVDPTEFANMVADIVIARLPHHEPVELMTQAEAAKFLKIGVGTLIAWRAKGAIMAYGIQSEVRYFKSDLIAALIQLESSKRK